MGSLHDYLLVLRRRAVAVVCACIVVPLLVLVPTLFLQRPLYEATAEVLLSNQNIGADLLGLPQSTPHDPQELDRIAQTQVDVATAPIVVERVLEAAQIINEMPRQFLQRSDVQTKPNEDVLRFTVEDRHSQRAQELATAYANAYTVYRSELDTRSLVAARREVVAEMTRLTQRGEQRTALYTNLASK